MLLNPSPFGLFFYTYFFVNSSSPLVIPSPLIIGVVFESIPSQKFICFLGPTAAELVLDGLDLLPLDPMQHRCENFPRRAQLVVTDEGGLGATQRVQHEAGVGIEQDCVRKARLVGKIEVSRDGSSLQTGFLHIELHVDSLVGLEAHDQLIARDVDATEHGT